MFKSDFTLLVEMQVAVSTCNTENSVLIIVSYRRNVPFLFHCYFLSSSQLNIKVVKFDFFAKSLEYYDRVRAVAINRTLDFSVMISLIDDLLSYIKPVVFLSLYSCNLLSDCFFSFLAIASLNGIPGYSINNILHELSPIHHTVTINIDLCEQFVTTVHQLIFFVIILTIDRI